MRSDRAAKPREEDFAQLRLVERAAVEGHHHLAQLEARRVEGDELLAEQRERAPRARQLRELGVVPLEDDREAEPPLQPRDDRRAHGARRMSPSLCSHTTPRSACASGLAAGTARNSASTLQPGCPAT